MGTVIIHLFIFCLLQLVKLSAYNLEFLTLLKNKNLKTQHISIRQAFTRIHTIKHLCYQGTELIFCFFGEFRNACYYG